MKYVSKLAPIGLMLVGASCSIGSFTGTVDGTTFTPKDAVSASAHFAAQTRDGVDLQDLSIGVVALTSTANACDDLKGNISRENEKAVLFYVMSVGDSAAQPSKGDYTQDANGLNAALITKTAGKFAIGEYEAGDANCQVLDSLSHGAGTMTAGKVTIDSADAGGTHGSYSVTFGSSDKATGTFSASNCAALDVSVNSLAYLLGYDVTLDVSAQDSNVVCKP